jgi:uncharacterized OB-fold protein
MSEQKSAHSAPLSNRDFDFFYEGLERQRLLIQRCDACDVLRTPPSPACPNCGSTAWTAVAARGTGTLFSYTVHYHPPLPGFKTPHPVGVIDLDEGVRVVAGLEAIPLERIKIGMTVTAEFIRRGEVASVRFREPGSIAAGALG